MNIEEERYIVATNMQRFGGGFASALENINIIKDGILAKGLAS